MIYDKTDTKNIGKTHEHFLHFFYKTKNLTFKKLLDNFGKYLHTKKVWIL